MKVEKKSELIGRGGVYRRPVIKTQIRWYFYLASSLFPQLNILGYLRHVHQCQFTMESLSRELRKILKWPKFQNRSLHCEEGPIYVFPEMKLRGFVPNFRIHVSVSNLYIPTIGPPILMEQNMQTDCGNIHIHRSQIHECTNCMCEFWHRKKLSSKILCNWPFEEIRLEEKESCKLYIVFLLLRRNNNHSIYLNNINSNYICIFYITVNPHIYKQSNNVNV